MGYRDDLAAAHARLEALERERASSRRHPRRALPPLLWVGVVATVVVGALWWAERAGAARAGECASATVWLDGQGQRLGTWGGRHLQLDFDLGAKQPDARPPSCLELRFDRPLDGARVDVTGYAGARSHPLWRGRRVSTDHVRVELEPELETVSVRVHRHLRGEPVLRAWRVGTTRRKG